MSFIFAETPGMYGAAAAHEGLALQTGTAGAAQAGAAGVVVPPGIEEVSAANVAKIQAYTADVAATLAAAAGLQGMYGASVASAGLGYDLTDAASAVPFTRIV